MRRDVRLGQGSKLRLNPKVCFLLEQPAEPPQEPTCASFWRTGEWKALKTILGLDLLTFNQGDFGGLAAKPTSLALNFPFQTPGGARGLEASSRSDKQGPCQMGSWDDEGSGNSGGQAYSEKESDSASSVVEGTPSTRTHSISTRLWSVPTSSCSSETSSSTGNP